MKIENEKVALFHFRLKNQQGITIDSSDGQPPLGYIHGFNNLMPGLENALAGHRKGDKFSVSLTPEESFGPHDEELVKDIPISEFENPHELKPGTNLQVHSKDGDQIVTVVEVLESFVKIDFNHPFAGQTLLFSIEVVEVRDATPDELDHGHLHGSGGCGH